jgi:hypothetical protein
MKITGYRKTKGGRALLGMLLLCAFSSQSVMAVQSPAVIVSECAFISFGSLLGVDRPPDRDTIRPPIIPRIPPK